MTGRQLRPRKLPENKKISAGKRNYRAISLQLEPTYGQGSRVSKAAKRTCRALPTAPKDLEIIQPRIVLNRNDANIPKNAAGNIKYS